MAEAPHRHLQRASREAIAVVRGATDTHAYLRGRLVTIAVGIVSPLTVYFAERLAAGTQIHDLFDARAAATASGGAAPDTGTAGA